MHISSISFEYYSYKGFKRRHNDYVATFLFYIQIHFIVTQTHTVITNISKMYIYLFDDPF